MIHKPTILFVHPDLRGGGAEKVLVNLLNSIDLTKYDVTLLTYFEEGINRNGLDPAIKQKFIFKKVFRGWSVIQKILTPRQLFKLFIKGKYNVIVAYLEGVPTRMVSGCPHQGTKLISWLHIDLENFGIEKVFQSTKEMVHCYEKFDAVVAVSKRSLASLIEIADIDRSKGYVIHNVVETQWILDNGKEKVTNIELDPQTVNLCTVGRLTRQKGYKRLVNVMGQIVKVHSNVKLYIIGDGELKDELLELIAENKLQDHVYLLGFQGNPHKYVAKCDLFVCSSFEEGYSTAVTESVILGTPVLTTACAGMDEILDDGNTGMIVENSEDGLHNGLLNLLENPDLINLFKEKTQLKSTYYQNLNNAGKVEMLFDTLLK
ncbi:MULTISPECIES: glycosyltransferase [Galbibacter]|uniref:Glycosyltransferase n=1 Tax=Galbibacter pacificus TaxID=2996052 RepID=A0ABT6FRA1_9FLAO|nr:glycosyltransferase [Galbibacter pacificus]MDG3581733.1 glycosyltransferase [Galbibacter pacificus]MDG3585793.1 glycosyltransferase [Galbibacter pacificus]